MKIDLSKPSAPRRFHAVFSGLYDLGVDIVVNIESKGFKPPISSTLMRMGKMMVIPQILTKYTSETDYKKQQNKIDWNTFSSQEEKRVLEEEEKCKTLIETFVTKTAAYWQEIKDRNINFLITNSGVLFSELPGNYVKGFSELFNMKENGKPVISPEYITALWDFLQAMVRISIRHIHTERKPNYIEVVSGGSTKDFKYTQDYFPTLKIKTLIDIWEIKLTI